MSEINFIQKIEDLEEIFLVPPHETSYIDEDLSVFVGKDSRKLYGIRIVRGNIKRDIWFSDIDRMGQIIERMKEN